MISVTVKDGGALIALDRIGRNTHRALRDNIETAAIGTRDLWRSKAKVTAGEHGRHYPKSIQYWMGGSLSVIRATIGPRGGRQSDMSFEEGSTNQPPHQDGRKALDTMRPRIRYLAHKSVRVE